jgi:aryl-phospho-beta-D-glucosidase BglC (GH1 family)
MHVASYTRVKILPDSTMIRLAASFALASLTMSGCDATGPQARFPEGIEIVGATELTGAPGFVIADPIRVRVVDARGEGMAGEVVSFTVISGGGKAEPASATTNADGIAATTWQLGPEAGVNILRAVYGDHSVDVAATATESPGDIIIKVSGGESAMKPAGCRLAEPLRVRVTNTAGAPVANATVEFNVTAGGGVTTPATAMTDANGMAEAQWSLGFDGGANTVEAVIGNSKRASVSFAATSTAAAPNGFSVIGNRIYDPATCQPILFHGATRPSLQWHWGGDDRFVDVDKDFATMRSWGVNLLRLPVSQTFWVPGNKQYDPGYKARVIDAVKKARATGMAVVVDLHAADRGNVNYSTVPDGQQMPDVNISLPFWKDVAATFKDDGGVIFELYNEPHDVEWDVWRNGGPVASGPMYAGGPYADGYMSVGMQQLYDAVREAGAKNLVLINGLHWGYFLDGVPDHRVTGYNIVYGAHPYDWPDKQPETWEGAFGSLTATDPVIISEFGAYDCTRLFYYDAVLDYADRKGMSWIAWAWWTPPPVSDTYTADQRQHDVCKFPALITDWGGTPSPSGQIIKARLATYH